MVQYLKHSRNFSSWYCTLGNSRRYGKESGSLRTESSCQAHFLKATTDRRLSPKSRRAGLQYLLHMSELRSLVIVRNRRHVAYRELWRTLSIRLINSRTGTARGLGLGIVQLYKTVEAEDNRS